MIHMAGQPGPTYPPGLPYHPWFNKGLIAGLIKGNQYIYMVNRGGGRLIYS